MDSTLERRHSKWEHDVGEKIDVSHIDNHPMIREQIRLNNELRSSLLAIQREASSRYQSLRPSLTTCGVTANERSIDQSIKSLVRAPSFEHNEAGEPTFNKVHDLMNLSYATEHYKLKETVMNFVSTLKEQRPSLSDYLETGSTSERIVGTDYTLCLKALEHCSILTEEESKRACQIVGTWILQSSADLKLRILDQLKNVGQELAREVRTAEDERSDERNRLWKCLLCFVVNKWKLHAMVGLC